MLSFDDKDIKRFEAELKVFANKAYPFATRNTLNATAFDARTEARENVRSSMINRNAFSVNSIRVKAERRELNVNRQQSMVGSIAEYMEDQEFGATQSKDGQVGVAIPTAYSAGQEGQRPITRLPRGKNKLSKIMFTRKGRRAKNKKQAILLKVQEAIISGQRYFYHDFGGSKRKGIFRVVGGSKRFKQGWPKGAQLKMVHDLSSQTVRIPKNPWLAPAVAKAEKRMPEFYRQSLIFQLKRQNLFQG